MMKRSLIPILLGLCALAALAGAGAYVLAVSIGIGSGLAAIGAALIAFIIRGCAIQFNWTLPPIGKVG